MDKVIWEKNFAPRRLKRASVYNFMNAATVLFAGIIDTVTNSKKNPDARTEMKNNIEHKNSCFSNSVVDTSKDTSKSATVLPHFFLFGRRSTGALDVRAALYNNVRKQDEEFQRFKSSFEL
uniref:Uncharacterized protein n=1 Tax=Strigamia maritima TaxID=126957 RepID=T1JN67_STRMM